MALARAALKEHLKRCPPEVVDEVLTRVKAVAFTGDVDAYLAATLDVVTSSLEEVIAARQASIEAMERQIQLAAGERQREIQLVLMDTDRAPASV